MGLMCPSNVDGPIFPTVRHLFPWESWRARDGHFMPVGRPTGTNFQTAVKGFKPTIFKKIFFSKCLVHHQLYVPCKIRWVDSLFRVAKIGTNVQSQLKCQAVCNSEFHLFPFEYKNYKAPFNYLFSISWYQEFDFLISRNAFFISIIFFWISRNIFLSRNRILVIKKCYINSKTTPYKEWTEYTVSQSPCQLNI